MAPKKIHALQVQAPRKIHAPSIRAGETVRQVHPRASELRLPASDATRTAVTPALTLVGWQTRAQLPALPEFAGLPTLPQAELPTMPPSELPAWPQLPALPQAQPPAWPQLPALPQAQPPATPQLPALPQAQPPATPRLPALPQVEAPASTRTAPRPSAAPAANQPPASVELGPLSPPLAFAPAPGLTKPPAAQLHRRTAPFPAPPRQPDDHSTPTGQARDSGGNNAPAVGTVSSSWRPEVAVAGRRLTADVIARGRTVRYAGPPS